MTNFPIRVPTNEQVYSLVADLKILADDVSGHLDSLEGYITSKTSSGAAVNFASITCTGAGIFSQVVVTSPGKPSGYLNNDGTSFGLSYPPNVSFLTDGSNWYSRGKIYLPTGDVGGDAAVSWNYLFNPSYGKLKDVLATDASLPNTYVSQATFNTSQANQNTAIANAQSTANAKANHWNGNPDWAPAANYANSANYANTAGTANNSNWLAGRYIRMGTTGKQYVKAGATNRQWFPFTPAHTYVPMVFVVATEDDGQASILCSTDGVTTAGFWLNYRNLNKEVTEIAHIHWMAI